MKHEKLIRVNAVSTDHVLSRHLPRFTLVLSHFSVHGTIRPDLNHLLRPCLLCISQHGDLNLPGTSVHNRITRITKFDDYNRSGRNSDGTGRPKDLEWGST